MTEETYTQPKHGWTCFHCGETLKTVGAAQDHFGEGPFDEPGCLMKVRVGNERGWLMEIRKLEEENAKQSRQIEEMDNEVSCFYATVSELKRLFNGARTVHQAWLVYESMESRALAAEEKLDAT